MHNETSIGFQSGSQLRYRSDRIWNVFQDVQANDRIIGFSGERLFVRDDLKGLSKIVTNAPGKTRTKARTVKVVHLVASR